MIFSTIVLIFYESQLLPDVYIRFSASKDAKVI
ncbi:hypothetical protein SAMN04489724_1037 [Algoriphagus locisalis]|uniref:Uncharacterized protein n=1 Tax=Algoriphagus locisalis TaxID=305507 RepID=A0A1I6YJ86_9BACT|nr:hypothetical protein SAMN04489724_1037 [Algoriphagus locisalis]